MGWWFVVIQVMNNDGDHWRWWLLCSTVVSDDYADNDGYCDNTIRDSSDNDMLVLHTQWLWLFAIIRDNDNMLSLNMMAIIPESCTTFYYPGIRYMQYVIARYMQYVIARYLTTAHY